MKYTFPIPAVGFDTDAKLYEKLSGSGIHQLDISAQLRRRANARERRQAPIEEDKILRFLVEGTVSERSYSWKL